jgi:predicted Rossmann-fold nucleotide-binding protein
MRKFWFAYLAKAMVVFPGGYGTLDEFFEMLTLAQTQKLENRIVLVLYGTEYWSEVLNFEALVRHGTISPEDVDLFSMADDPISALKVLQDGLSAAYLTPEAPVREEEKQTPSIAKSRI